jgi:hypothetical protein
MSPEKINRLRAIGQDPEIELRVTLRTIFTETERYLETLVREVRECKSVNEASHFCRWLQFSGVLKLLEAHPTPDADFKKLRKKVNDIVFDCGELYKGGRADAKYGASDIAEINSKLDFLLSKIPQAHSQTDTVVEVEEPSHAARPVMLPAHSQEP